MVSSPRLAWQPQSLCPCTYTRHRAVPPPLNPLFLTPLPVLRVAVWHCMPSFVPHVRPSPHTPRQDPALLLDWGRDGGRGIKEHFPFLQTRSQGGEVAQGALHWDRSIPASAGARNGCKTTRGSGPHGQQIAQDEALVHPQDHSRGTAGVGESLWDQCNVEARPRGGSRAEWVAEAEGWWPHSASCCCWSP